MGPMEDPPLTINMAHLINKKEWNFKAIFKDSTVLDR